MQTSTEAVIQWLKESDKQYFVIKGGAGTGKTHNIIELQERIPNSIVVSFTNKAVKVIINRGGSAHTIHSTFFKVIPTGKYKTIYTPKINSITHQVEKDSSGNTVLSESVEEICNYLFDSHAVSKKGIDLNSEVVVIVDESSMVPIEILYEFLEHTDFRFIFIGDHNQLPPINPDYDSLKKEMEMYLRDGLTPNEDDFHRYLELKQYDKFFENAPADYLLTVNFRQASGSVINVISDSILNTGSYPTSLTVKGLVEIVDMYKDKVTTDTLTATFAAASQKEEIIIAWKNETCNKINSRVRAEIHAATFSKKPQNQHSRYLAGDKLYVNSKFSSENLIISKGSFIHVIRVLDYDYINNLAIADCTIDDSTEIVNLILDQGYVKTRVRGISAVNTTFGFCITAHKSQGSQWDIVIVVDEGIHIERKRWLYTAITRAKNCLIVIKGEIK